MCVPAPGLAKISALCQPHGSGSATGGATPGLHNIGIQKRKELTKTFMMTLKVIYHLLYGMNNYVLIWGDWLSCDPLRRSHDSRSPHIWG